MPAIPESARPMSTAGFNAPNGRTEIDENIADILDVIGKRPTGHRGNNRIDC